jgi:broad specificity phosphatase PhoE
MPELISEYRPKMIYSSALGRAAFSSSIYSQLLGIPVYFRPNLVELSCGEWEKSPRSQVKGPRKIVRSSWVDRPPGGESYQDGEERLRDFVRDLTSGCDDTCKMVLAHASLNRALVKLVLGLPPQEAISILFPHDTVYIIQNDGMIRWFGLSTGSGCGFLREV